MKKYIIGLVAAMAVASPACDTLDIESTSKFNEDTPYESIENMDLYVKNFYLMYHHIANIECGTTLNMLEDVYTDLIKSSWYNVNGGAVNKYFYMDNYVTVESNFRSNWSTMYAHIRKCNEFLVNLKAGKMANLPEASMKQREGEVRFIRAFAYQELIKYHGGVVLRISEDKVDNQDDNAKARSTEAESWDFVLNEYDKAIALLPESWDKADYGRITKQGAQAMKARAALYAERWDDAYTAADNVINSNAFTLSTDYADIFANSNNKEIIIPVLFEVKKKQHNWDTFMSPPGDAAAFNYEGQYGGAATPTEEFASQFDIKVGGTWESFDWENLAKYGNEPFKNRDPRFYETILYNGATWKGREIQCYSGGTDQCMTFNPVSTNDNVHKGTTGYYVRKFLTTDEYNFVNVLSDQHWIEMRLAEVYLIRSEAAARKDNWGQAYLDLNIIRNRVGLPDKPQKGSWEEYLVDLQKERICELGVEGHRYDDIVRWGIASDVLNGQRVHGIKVTKSGSSYKYEVIEADTQDRKYPKKYEIFPIPYSEVQNNPLCEQNDAWK